MNAEITLPPLGETVEEGTILRWYKTVGEWVDADEPLYEVETDKVVSDVPAASAGYLVRVTASEGDTVPVGAVLGAMSSEPPSEATEETPPTPPRAAPAVPPAPAPVTDVAAAGADGGGAAPRLAPRDDPRVMSPLVRRLLQEHGVDPEVLEGSGHGGRITRDDVLRHVERGPDAATPRPAAPPQEPLALAEPTGGPGPAAAGDERVPFTSIRRITAEHMVRSKATSAHTLTIVAVDYEAIAQLRQEVGDAWKADEGFSLTYLPFILRATVDALRQFPRVNASVGDHELVVHKRINVGVAVDLDMEGLVVPVIKDVDGMRLRGIARAVRTLSERARARRLGADELRDGTFTVTNPGGYGTFAGAAIINQPQVAILNTDGIAKEPVVVERPGEPDSIGIHHVGRLSLSWDHRAIDGAYAAAFLDTVRNNLQSRDWYQEL